MTDTLAEALREARADLAAYIDAEWPEQMRDTYPPVMAKWKRDMELCWRIDAALAAYDAKREAALKELADLGQAYDAAPGPARLLDDASFLLDRLNEYELSDNADEMCRSFIGHVEPAMRRLSLAIAALAPAASPAQWSPPPAWADVLTERRRQIEVEGWHPARDDMYTSGELALAGAAYAAASTYYHTDPYAAVLSIWPWDRAWLKPTTPRRDLVKAAALILAEIERLDRTTFAPLPSASAQKGEAT